MSAGKGLVATVFVRGGQRGLLSLPAALDALGRTSFHWTDALRRHVLARYGDETIR